MKEYKEEDYLMLSGIQHFAFCRRQWALIHIEQQWQENVRTVEGELLHKRAHDTYSSEKRNDVVISRGLPVHSSEMGSAVYVILWSFAGLRRESLFTGTEGPFRSIPLSIKGGNRKIRR